MKTTETKLYLAYGSNMDLEAMAYRCPDAKLLACSSIPNYHLLFKGSKANAYATIEPKEGSVVPILVWEISQQDERNLDRYESYPSFYRKETIPIQLDGETVEGMAYVMEERYPLGAPTAYYYDVLDRAYHRFGFDKNVLKAALEKSCR